MSHGKQFTLYTHAGGPNGWKVALVMEELGLTYESVYLDFRKVIGVQGEHKGPDYLKINPNGRIPAIIDHNNNDFTLWESCAIILYLLDKYDPEHKISATGELDKYRQLQWLFFQASGQGPYYGQLGWFGHFHPERLQSAIDRYRKEALRVLGVLESVLSKQEWLVGDKFTAADLAFLPWNLSATGAMLKTDDWSFEKEFPSTYLWQTKILERPAVKKVLDIKAKVSAH